MTTTQQDLTPSTRHILRRLFQTDMLLAQADAMLSDGARGMAAPSYPEAGVIERTVHSIGSQVAECRGELDTAMRAIAERDASRTAALPNAPVADLDADKPSPASYQPSLASDPDEDLGLFTFMIRVVVPAATIDGAKEIARSYIETLQTRGPEDMLMAPEVLEVVSVEPAK